jgi:hypothetical protein
MLQTFIILYLANSALLQEADDEIQCVDEYCDYSCSTILVECSNKGYFQKCVCESDDINYVDFILEFFKRLGLIFSKPARPLRPLRPFGITTESSLLLLNSSTTTSTTTTTTTTTTTKHVVIIDPAKRIPKKPKS